MKRLLLLLGMCCSLFAGAQLVTPPYNPDGNYDQVIGTTDLIELLTVFGSEWMVEQPLVDGMPLSEYLELIQNQSSLPDGTMPGQFLQWDGDAWQLVMPRVGCTLPEACNYDPTAHVLDEERCIQQDACGVCDGPGAIYDCGCSDIPEGECDCEGNVLDALGVCGGPCSADIDGDGICDDGDTCVGEADACGVCNGPGPIYECGCTEPLPDECDCEGNVEDVLGVCGGGCTADEDGDGICDDVDDCVGIVDDCGECNGPGPILGCGCDDVPEGFCDCQGNVLDAVGTCGGACQNDVNGDGICDDDSIPGCTYAVACNYDPSASINDGSCDFTSCYGCSDITACNYNPAVTNDNGTCWYPEPSFDCDYNCLIDTDGDGVCDGLEVFGCTDVAACNFEPGATELDDSCTYPGCNNEAACNFDPEAGCDDGSCVDDGFADCIDPEACNFNPDAICSDGSCQYLDECGECGGSGTLGCTNPLATNYDETATCDDGSCIVYGCTVDLACNYEPTANVDDNSCEFGTCPGCGNPDACNYNPTTLDIVDSLCVFGIPYSYITGDLNYEGWGLNYFLNAVIETGGEESVYGSVELNDCGPTHIEGSDDDYCAFRDFVSGSREDLESYVSSGGVIFMNAAPNGCDGTFEFLFDVTRVDDFYGNVASAVNPNHPLFAVHNAETVFYGGNSHHGNLNHDDSWEKLLIGESGESILIAKQIGQGHVVLGTLTLQWEWYNGLHSSIISYLQALN